jgi:hypothetical protein
MAKVRYRRIVGIARERGKTVGGIVKKTSYF